jgi:hypothetical protein
MIYPLIFESAPPKKNWLNFISIDSKYKCSTKTDTGIRTAENEGMLTTRTCSEPKHAVKLNSAQMTMMMMIIMIIIILKIYVSLCVYSLDVGLLARSQYPKVLRPPTTTQVFLGFPLSTSEC